MKELRDTVASVSQDQHSSVSKEVKDLHSSVDQLLAIVNSLRNEIQGGGGGGGGGRGIGIEEN